MQMTDSETEVSQPSQQTEPDKPDAPAGLARRMDSYSLVFLMFAGAMAGIFIGTMGYLLLN